IHHPALLRISTASLLRLRAWACNILCLPLRQKNCGAKKVAVSEEYSLNTPRYVPAARERPYLPLSAPGLREQHRYLHSKSVLAGISILLYYQDLPEQHLTGPGTIQLLLQVLPLLAPVISSAR